MPILLPSPVFRWFIPAQNGTGLVPAEGYKAKFYSAGTTDAKAIYDVDNVVYPSPSNTATLNSEGYAGIKLGTGSYKLVVTDPDDSPVYTQDNISGAGDFASGFLDTVIATDDPATNGLAQYDTANRFVWCAGYYAVGDGGHGFFWNDTSSDSDDGGYVIASTFAPSKRWFRVPDESGDVRAASFGYIGSKSGNLSNQMLSACAYAQSYGKRLIIGPGSTAILGVDATDFYIYAPYVHFEAQSMLTGTGSFANFQIVGIASGTAERHFTGAGYQLQTVQVNANPEWSGAALGSLDNSAAFTIWLNSLPYGGSFVLPPGTWAWTGNTASFPYPTVPLLLYGTIDGSVGSDIPPGAYYPDASRLRAGEFRLPNGTTITGPAGSTIVATGDVSVIGALSTSTDSGITSGGNVSANGVVSAGIAATGGWLSARAGISSIRVAATGRYITTIGSAATSGTGITTLLTATLYADTAINVGDCLRIKVAGSCTGGAGNRLIEIYIGAVSIAAVNASITSGHFEINCDLFYSAAGTLAAYWTGIIQEGTTTPSGTRCDSVTGSITWTANQTIACKGTAAAGSITNTLLTIDHIPQYT